MKPDLSWGVVAVLTVAVFASAPRAAAEPFPPVTAGQSAAAVIDDLQAQGYDVQINWLNGFDTKPLSECTATRVNDPGNAAPSGDTLTTVYVDVVCPNSDDGGFNVGVGIG